MTAVKVAKEWGWSPAAILLDYEDARSTTKHDFALAMALNILDNEKCPKCGVPIWHAYSENNTIAFELDKQECHSCAHKEHEEAKIKKPKAGVTNFVKAVPVEGFELPTRRDFYMEMADKAE